MYTLVYTPNMLGGEKMTKPFGSAGPEFRYVVRRGERVNMQVHEKIREAIRLHANYMGSTISEAHFDLLWNGVKLRYSQPESPKVAAIKRQIIELLKTQAREHLVEITKKDKRFPPIVPKRPAVE